jgi:hypothetical protein
MFLAERETVRWGCRPYTLLRARLGQHLVCWPHSARNQSPIRGLA